MVHCFFHSSWSVLVEMDTQQRYEFLMQIHRDDWIKMIYVLHRHCEETKQRFSLDYWYMSRQHDHDLPKAKSIEMLTWRWIRGHDIMLRTHWIGIYYWQYAFTVVFFLQWHFTQMTISQEGQGIMLLYFEDRCVGPLCTCDHTHFRIALTTTKIHQKTILKLKLC